MDENSFKRAFVVEEPKHFAVLHVAQTKFKVKNYKFFGVFILYGGTRESKHKVSEHPRSLQFEGV